MDDSEKLSNDDVIENLEDAWNFLREQADILNNLRWGLKMDLLTVEEVREALEEELEADLSGGVDVEEQWFS